MLFTFFTINNFITYKERLNLPVVQYSYYNNNVILSHTHTTTSTNFRKIPNTQLGSRLKINNKSGVHNLINLQILKSSRGIQQISKHENYCTSNLKMINKY